MDLQEVRVRQDTDRKIRFVGVVAWGGSSKVILRKRLGFGTVAAQPLWLCKGAEARPPTVKALRVQKFLVM